MNEVAAHSRKARRYDLRVHFAMGPDKPWIQARHAWGRTAKEAADSFLEKADRCMVEVLSSDGRVIYTA